MTTSHIPCRYAIGRCPFGERCMFDHNLETLNQGPMPGKLHVGTSPKRLVEIPLSGNRNSGRLSLAFAPSPLPCRHYAKGSCLFGESCRNLHVLPPAPTTQKPVCKYYTSGACIYGENCRYEHSSPVSHLRNNVCGAPTSEGVEAPTAYRDHQRTNTTVNLTSLDCDEKHIVGPTKALFGAGAEVIDLVTVDQSRRFVIENLHEESSDESVSIALSRRFGNVKELTLVRNRRSVTAIVALVSVKEAQDAVGFIKLAIPEGMKEAPFRTLSVYSVPDTTNLQGSHLTTTVLVSCHYPSRLAWVHFSTIQRASDTAQRLNRSLRIGGRSVECRFQAPRFGRPTNYTVVLSNLPENVSKEALLHTTSAHDVTINPPQYTSKDFQTVLPPILRQYGNLLSFDISPNRPNTKKLYAFARFETANESFEAVKQLHDQKLERLGRTPIYLELINSIKYSVRSQIWTVLEPEVKKALEDIKKRTNDSYSTVRFAVYDTDGSQYVQKFRIYGKDVKALGAAKVAVDRILKGELLKSDDAPIWDREFEMTEGRNYLESLNIPNRCFISSDVRLRTITLYGDAAARAQSKTHILNHIQALQARRHSANLTKSELTKLLSGGLRLLQSRYGETNVRLDVIQKILEINGNGNDAETARNMLLSMSIDRVQSRDEVDTGDCPICFCVIEDAVEIGCGHTYCKECFDNYITSTIRNRSFPLCCISCGEKVALPILRSFNNFDRLFQAAFKCFISNNSNAYSYCPTPDCPQIYRVGPLGTVAQCSECLIRICTACKIEWHEGMSCEEIQELKDPEMQKNQALMKSLGVKRCPRCKSNIEKVSGCNHMTCGGCKTHICWVCLQDFGETGSSKVYEHMREEHGGIGI